MAVPRPVMLAILGLALIAGAFLVTRSGSNESVTHASKAAQAPATPHPVKPLRPMPGTHVHKPATAVHKPATPVPTHTAPRAARPRVPADVEVPDRAEAAAKALGSGKVVVFFFTKPGTPDDSATASAVHSLKGMKRVAVFVASLDEIASYRPMLANVGISEVPAVVIVRPGQQAVLFEGFVDAGTLRQNVADALR